MLEELLENTETSGLKYIFVFKATDLLIQVTPRPLGSSEPGRCALSQGPSGLGHSGKKAGEPKPSKGQLQAPLVWPKLLSFPKKGGSGIIL